MQNSSETHEMPSLEAIAAEIIVVDLPSYKNAQVVTRLFSGLYKITGITLKFIVDVELCSIDLTLAEVFKNDSFVTLPSSLTVDTFLLSLC